MRNKSESNGAAPMQAAKEMKEMLQADIDYHSLGAIAARNNRIKCTVENAELDSPEFGKMLGSVILSREEATHFCASGPHNSTVSLNEEDHRSLGIEWIYGMPILIRSAELD